MLRRENRGGERDTLQEPSEVGGREEAELLLGEQRASLGRARTQGRLPPHSPRPSCRRRPGPKAPHSCCLFRVYPLTFLTAEAHKQPRDPSSRYSSTN